MKQRKIRKIKILAAQRRLGPSRPLWRSVLKQSGLDPAKIAEYNIRD